MASPPSAVADGEGDQSDEALLQEAEGGMSTGGIVGTSLAVVTVVAGVIGAGVAVFLGDDDDDDDDSDTDSSTGDDDSDWGSSIDGDANPANQGNDSNTTIEGLLDDLDDVD